MQPGSFAHVEGKPEIQRELRILVVTTHAQPKRCAKPEYTCFLSNSVSLLCTKARFGIVCALSPGDIGCIGCPNGGGDQLGGTETVKQMNSPHRNPKVRVATVIPVFQAQAELDQTLCSLRNSSIPNTVFVVDDGSLPPIQLPVEDSQMDVHYLRLSSHQGIVAALNAGITAAVGEGYEYIARIDAGDLATPNRLPLQVAWLDAHSRCMLVGCDAEVRTEDGAYCFTIQPPRDPVVLAKALHERAWLLHPSVMFRACVFKEVGLYSGAYEAAEDYDLFLRIAQKYEIGVVPEPLLIYMLRPGSISARKGRVQAISRLRIQLSYFQWQSWIHLYGLLRTCASLLIPGWVKRSLKMRFLYSWLPARSDRAGVDAAIELRTR
jgi:glycosyltransferase involved in cell wall biosynthesis